MIKERKGVRSSTFAVFAPDYVGTFKTMQEAEIAEKLAIESKKEKKTNAERDRHMVETIMKCKLVKSVFPDFHFKPEISPVGDKWELNLVLSYEGPDKDKINSMLNSLNVKGSV